MAENQVSEKPPSPEKAGITWVRRHWVWVALVGLALVVVGGAYWWLFMHNRVSTDDAYVHADVAQMSTRIPGTVARVWVRNDDRVTVGQTLLELDPADYRVALDKKQAALAQAEAEVEASRVSVTQTEAGTSAQVAAAEAAHRGAQERETEARHRLQELQSQRSGVVADLALAQKDFARFDNLYRQGAGSAQQREEALTTLEKRKAQLGSIDAQIKAVESALAAAAQEAKRASAQVEESQSTRDSVQIQRHRLEALKAARDKARAEVEQARLNLSYTTVTAPIAGYVAQKSVQVGDRVQPGQALMAIVPLGDVYVEANFKETDLTNVRIGQPARVTADMYPDHAYAGKVVGIRAGTGSAFSLLPPQNATGNWIKVVRRIPVRIDLDRAPPEDRPLRVGMSLEVTVDTSNRSGPVLQSRSLSPPPAAEPQGR